MRLRLMRRIGRKGSERLGKEARENRTVFVVFPTPFVLLAMLAEFLFSGTACFCFSLGEFPIWFFCFCYAFSFCCRCFLGLSFFLSLSLCLLFVAFRFSFYPASGFVRFLMSSFASIFTLFGFLLNRYYVLFVLLFLALHRVLFSPPPLLRVQRSSLAPRFCLCPFCVCVWPLLRTGA